MAYAAAQKTEHRHHGQCAVPQKERDRGLQNFPKTEFTVGGLTALEMRGLAHYLPMDKRKTVHLYGWRTVPETVSKASAVVQMEP